MTIPTTAQSGAFDFLNPFIQKQLASTARQLLNIAAGILVAKDLLTESQSYDLTEALMPLVLAGIAQAWTYIDNKRERRKLATAQALPAGVTEKQVESVVKEGKSPPATLPKDAHPHIEGTRGPGTEDLTGVAYKEPYRGDRG
jgi:hypothetical protein